MSKSEKSFTGRKRRRQTRGGVIWADRIAKFLITMGGIGTIIAVSSICVFLIWVVIPLFLSPSLERGGELEIATKSPGVATAKAEKGVPKHFQVDEHMTMSWAFFGDGSIRTFSLIDGSELQRLQPFGDQVPTCWSFSVDNEQCAFGFSDGSVRLGNIGFETTFLEEEDLPSGFREMEVATTARHENGIVERTPERQFRLKTLSLDFEEPVSLAEEALILIDQSWRMTGPVFAAVTKNGSLSINSVRKRKNLLTGKTTLSLSGGGTQVSWGRDEGPPSHLLISGLGDNIYLIWEDGDTIRFDSREGDPKIAEKIDLVEAEGEKLTAATFMIGKSTLITGDSCGRVRAWFRIKPESATTPDGSTLASAVDLPMGEAAVTALGPSSRSRMLAVGFADGNGRLYHVTANQLLGGFAASSTDEVGALLLAPKEDAVFASTGKSLRRWNLDSPHGEITLASIFTPVWYEGYDKPEHVWQSSSGTDDFEPKYGLYPLIFGTLKATIYSMLFGVPLAILAAIYTSEFLHPRVKSRVKPFVEMMASLPSVVLGFLAALVIAPMVEDYVPESIMVVVALPTSFVLAGFLWQLLPKRLAMRLSHYRVTLLLLAVPFALAIGLPLARPMEKLLYGGDIKAWLDHQTGTGLGGWMFLFLPLSAMAVAFWIGRSVNPQLRRMARGWSHRRFAFLDLGKFLVGVGLTLGLAFGISWTLSTAGMDPRGSFVDTYVQRNAMVVGFIMGFAVIPIIYTIAEDALSAVPEHLRAASLGAGATPWQTAVRIILPTAMSGLFSAVMIGLGRAVGETMIVLMAAGNTPVLDWNIFNGFRTLSANIAVELPEAVQNSSHYRMLFLAALSLFAMTFVVNTIAEIIRLRFRKRAFEL